MRDSLRALVDEVKSLETLQKKILAKLVSAEQCGDQREITICNLVLLEIDAQVDQIEIITSHPLETPAKIRSNPGFGVQVDPGDGMSTQA